ncbi:MAG: hypothetical protein EAY72_12945 [Bacteroidetes bacterium]|nr:MAG: hypothetical protein EAY72_12945 [Bacteroidota bacterium]
MNFVKKIFSYLQDVGVAITLLATLLYYSLTLFEKYAPLPLEYRETYGMRFIDCLATSLLYTIPTIISYPILMVLLKKITNPMKFKYLIGSTIAVTVSLVFKLSTFGVDFTDYQNNITLFMVAVFGAFIAKTMSKYVPT